jgi:hypothetical protein
MKNKMKILILISLCLIFSFFVTKKLNHVKEEVSQRDTTLFEEKIKTDFYVSFRACLKTQE